MKEEKKIIKTQKAHCGSTSLIIINFTFFSSHSSEFSLPFLKKFPHCMIVCVFVVVWCGEGWLAGWLPLILSLSDLTLKQKKCVWNKTCYEIIIARRRINHHNGIFVILSFAFSNNFFLYSFITCIGLENHSLLCVILVIRAGKFLSPPPTCLSHFSIIREMRHKIWPKQARHVRAAAA
jgi:hypothetical protein